MAGYIAGKWCSNLRLPRKNSLDLWESRSPLLSEGVKRVIHGRKRKGIAP